MSTCSQSVSDAIQRIDLSASDWVYIKDRNDEGPKTPDIGLWGILPGVTTGFSAVKIVADVGSLAWNVCKVACSFFMFARDTWFLPAGKYEIYRENRVKMMDTTVDLFKRDFVQRIDSIVSNLLYAIPIIGYYSQKVSRKQDEAIHVLLNRETSKSLVGDSSTTADLEKILEEQGNELTALQDKLKSQTEGHSKLEEECKALQGRAALYQEAAEQLSEKTKSLQLEKAALEQQVEAERQRFRKADEEAKTATGKLSQASQNVALMQQQISELSQKLQECERSRESVIAEVAKLKKDVEHSAEEKDALREKIRSLEGKRR